VHAPINRRGQANSNVVDEELGCAPKGTLGCHLDLLEQQGPIHDLMSSCTALLQCIRIGAKIKEFFKN
jgi:hypothetical protein